MGILIQIVAIFVTFWNWTLYRCHTSGERLSVFPMIRWGLGLTSPFQHRLACSSFTPSVRCWGPGTCFGVTSSSQRWLHHEKSPFSYLNFWNRGNLLRSDPFFIHCPPELSIIPLIYPLSPHMKPSCMSGESKGYRWLSIWKAELLVSQDLPSGRKKIRLHYPISGKAMAG